ncbi:MAG TPA: clostripain-related cysteine peptidase [candidate division Zixibacteria bacterium]|nr:clostripain-related cysteine peptidase [candidate division Zixibacteria bacterium]
MIKKKLTTICIIFVILSVTFSFENLQSKIEVNPSTLNKQTTKFWTCMIYCCADTRMSQVEDPLNNSYNYLHQVMYDSLYDLPYRLHANTVNDMNIIVLYDYPYTQTNPNGVAIMYSVTPTGVNQIGNWSASNMGWGGTLKNFIHFCKTNYPAYYYSLNLVDHGRGYAGFCYDYHAPHPYWEYALGDCLEVQEVENALAQEGGVDVLFLDTCSGGSFEAAWQFFGEADYMVAGETVQSYVALCHFVDICAQLSHSTSTTTPAELAQIGFDFAKAVNYWSPVLNPTQNLVSSWPSVTLYSLNRFVSVTGGPSFMTVFEELTNELYNELLWNRTLTQELFSQIRANMSTTSFSSNSLMVDLYDFVDVVIDFSDQFNNTNIGPKATAVKTFLEEGLGHIIQENWVYSESSMSKIKGFSICLPESRDLYQGYLYPNFYEDLDVSVDTLWDEFIFDLFPPNITDYLKPPNVEFWEYQLNLIDPAVSFHLYIYRDDELYHVGLNDITDFGMGIDIELEGAQFYDDLLFGNSYIQIPATSLEIGLKNSLNDPIIMKVVIDATASPSATQLVNLTVSHVKNNNVVWSVNKVTDFEVGQLIECNVTTDDTITDFVKSTTTPTKRFDINSSTTTIVISTAFVLLIIIDRCRRKKNQ